MAKMICAVRCWGEVVVLVSFLFFEFLIAIVFLSYMGH
jgi:hypothetical protein